MNVLLKTDSELTLILEDDFQLCENFDSELKKCLDELPSNFQALWLGGRIVGKSEKHSDNLVKVNGMTGTYGYIVHYSFIDSLIEALSKEAKLADWSMSSVFKNVYKAKKNLVKHRDGYSYILKKEVSYKDLR